MPLGGWPGVSPSTAEGWSYSEIALKLAARAWTPAHPARTASCREYFLPKLLPAEILRGKFPIGELVEHRVDVIGAPILVVKIVGMLPYVNRQQNPHPLSQGSIRIAGFHHLEFLTVLNQPGPAAAELPHGSRRQFLLACLDAAESRFHQPFQRRRRLAAALGLQASPVERVIPCLRRVVENGDGVGLP